MQYEKYNAAVREMIQEVLANRGRDAEKTLESCNRIEEYGMHTNDEKLLGFACYYRAETYYLLNDVAQEFYELTRGLEYLQRSAMWEEAASAYNLLAITFVNRGNATVALEYYLRALTYADRYQLEEMRYIVNLNIGSLYAAYGQKQQALRYFEESQTVLKQCRKQYKNAALENAEIEAELEVHEKNQMLLYISMADCYLGIGQMEKAQEYLQRAWQKCRILESKPDELYLFCFEARIYQALGRTEERDACIQKVRGLVTENMTILETFDDLYSYCEMLLSIEKYEELWEILPVLNRMTAKAHLIHLEKKVLSMKLQYYKKVGDHAGYLQGAGLYYELCQMFEKENNDMVCSAMEVRFSLQEAKRRQKEVENENQYLQEKSETDPLTHLANRFRFHSFAEEAFRRCQKKQQPFAIEILDIDYFKQFNDNYGHQKGDSCIVCVAKALQELEQQERVYAARYGGDEFVVVYEGYSAEDAAWFSNALRQRIMDENMPHLYSKVRPFVTISQGLCCDIPTGEDTVSDFLHSADEMLYVGKENSRNSIYLGNLQKQEIWHLDDETVQH
ncbi:MAG: diguanylate cyclase domain-containing protein [Lachnospiraceae bacterium]